MLGGIMTKTVYIVIAQPPHSAVCTGFGYLRLAVVQAGHIGFEPGAEALFIPESKILSAIRQFQRSEPVGVFGPQRMFCMHMVSNIVKNNIHVFFVQAIDQSFVLGVGSKAVVHLRQADGPVTVIAGEPAVGFRIFLIGHMRVLHDRRQP